MQESKPTVLALLKIFVKESDRNHILSAKDIQRLLEQEYGITIERRAVYSNIETLQNFGIDINGYRENKKGYYLDERQFEESEISLLCHSIHASHIIPDKESDKLIDKLLATQNKYVAANFKNHVYTKNYRKSKNKQFFLNIELLLDAITNHHKITFMYTKYNFHKEKIDRRSKPYEILPYDIVYANGSCYLIGFNEHYQDYNHYRIDKMIDIKIEVDTFNINTEFNAYTYSSSKIFMYGGEEVSVYMRCDDEILDYVLDTFGTNTFIQKEKDSDTFITKITASKDGIIYWALQYLSHATLIEPKDIRDEVIQKIENGLENYRRK